jgi:hypothetical protein
MKPEEIYVFLSNDYNSSQSRRQQYESSPPRTIQIACIVTRNRKISLHFHIYSAISYMQMRMRV